MPIVDIDHVAIPTARPEELLVFYRGLGCHGPTPEAWRERGVPFFSLSMGNTKINVHAPAIWQDGAMTLRGREARPGCGDLCFVWAGTVEEARDALVALGAPIEEGPVLRRGGRHGGRAEGTSLYTRDPDGNLVELIIYVEPAA